MAELSNRLTNPGRGVSVLQEESDCEEAMLLRLKFVPDELILPRAQESMDDMRGRLDKVDLAKLAPRETGVDLRNTRLADSSRTSYFFDTPLSRQLAEQKVPSLRI
mmetsp:Transcript_77883/g.178258  ORF Transcript_77883/g.178258 Transcript_77883/m.178258 type:complete len:106 (+) Transcript_77883:391-708(+)